MSGRARTPRLRMPDEVRDLGRPWESLVGSVPGLTSKLEKEFRFDDFRSALGFTNRVGELAEEQGHHPDIHLSWGRVRIEIWTHKIDGLTESDFVLAAKVDEL